MLRARAVSVNAERTRVTKKAPRRRREVGGSPARSLAAVVNHSSPRTPAKVPAKDQRRRQVNVVGDSNMVRVGEVIKGRVGDDERVKVSKLPGKRVGEVMQQAKEQLRDRMEDRSLVVFPKFGWAVIKNGQSAYDLGLEYAEGFEVPGCLTLGVLDDLYEAEF
ncbi:hypothetical protein MRX96_019733 [Rhipicephalus microplus]